MTDNEVFWVVIVKLQVLGLRLVVDFTFTLDNINKNNKIKNNHNNSPKFLIRSSTGG